MPALPAARGELSELLLTELASDVHSLAPVDVAPEGDPLGDDDLHLALYLCYELHYRGLPDVDDGWEWEPSLIALRGRMERLFEDGLRRAVGEVAVDLPSHETASALRDVIAADDAPSLSTYLARHGTHAEVLEFVVHRSAYQLKEADPHSWALPRLSGAPKAALVEVQADEYGGGRVDRVHAELFAKTMDALSLDSRYGAYLDHIPGVTLATVNLMSLLGLHRRLRGAIVGHLATFEMTSSVANRRYGDALRRLGFGERATDFFDEHVEADAVHENIAAVDLAGGLLRQDPGQAANLLFGARCLVETDARWARHVLSRWGAGESSLRVQLRERMPA
jgi:hypothetical protein